MNQGKLAQERRGKKGVGEAPVSSSRTETKWGGPWLRRARRAETGLKLQTRFLSLAKYYTSGSLSQAIQLLEGTLQTLLIITINHMISPRDNGCYANFCESREPS